MAQQTSFALPPTAILSTTRISQSHAHDFLAAYLQRAATDAALQPSAAITEHGPVSRTTAAAPNLILHNLKRVQAGLAGEVLGRDLSLVEVDSAAPPKLSSAATPNIATATTDADESWEDSVAWQARGDVDDENDNDNDNNDDDDNDGMAAADDQTAVEDDTAAQVMDRHQLDGASQAPVVDKDDRKRKKKQRRLAEKRAKAQAVVDAEE